MAKLKIKMDRKTEGILLLVAAGLILINVPLIDEKIIAFVIVLLVGLYNLIK